VTAKPRTESKPQRLLKAVGHPVRAKAFNVLMNEAASPKQISLLTGEEIHTVAYHVKVLEELEVIELVDTAPRRGATEHYYRATTKPNFSDEEWAKFDRNEREAVSLAAFQLIMADFARALEERTFDNRADRHLIRIPTSVDEEGWNELYEVFHAAYEGIKDVQKAVERRREEKGSRHLAFPISVILCYFELPGMY
jgi:DNA-binding transcriptional ArsR family regulator